VQHILGHHGGVAFDVAAVCSGFLYGFSVAESMIRAGSAKNALVIGAETMTRLLDWEDRGTCVLFGDGAGAVVLSGEVGEARRSGDAASCRRTSTTNCSMSMAVRQPPGTVGKLRMQGREVFRHAVTNLASVMHEVLDQAELEPDRR
jgi:3-oxoacyl-[acyl-carrier-protein] synthase-3